MAASRQLGGTVVNMLCAIVCLIALGFIAPAAFGLERYVIAGSSMTGSIDLGSIVYDEVVPVADLRVGDVITYMPPADSGIDHLVTHRIVSIKGDRFRTKGDANAAADPWKFRLQAATQPRVAFHVPLAGYPLLALQQRDLRMLLIGVPAGIVFLLALAELLGLGRRRNVQDDAQAHAHAGTGPVVKVLVPAQPRADEAGQPRRRAWRRRPTTVRSRENQLR